MFVDVIEQRRSTLAHIVSAFDAFVEHFSLNIFVHLPSRILLFLDGGRRLHLAKESLQPYGLYGLCWYHFDHCFDYVQDNYHDTEDDQQYILGKIVLCDYRSVSSSRIYHAGTCTKRNHCDIAMTDKGTLLISIRCIRLAFYFERRPFFGVTRAIPFHPNLIGL